MIKTYVGNSTTSITWDCFPRDFLYLVAMSRDLRHPPDPGLLQAQVLRLMRPLVRLMIGAGVTFPAFTDLVRKVYVSVAENDFALETKEQTDSRISLLTGVHRKEVRRLRGEGYLGEVISPDLSLTSQIAARWLGSEPFTDAAGKPLPLPRIGAETTSFEALVVSVTKDVRPRAILDEWLDRGLVKIDAQDRVILLEAGVVPKPGAAEQLYYFGRNLHDHISAASANVAGAARPFLERSVHYDGLGEDAARHLETLSRDFAMQALRQANAGAQEALVSRPGSGWRWNFGVYVYLEEEASAAEATSAAKAPDA